MMTSKFLVGSFVTTAALLSGLTFATAQSTTATTQAPVTAEATDTMSGECRKDGEGREGRGHGGHRGGHGMMRQMMEKVDADGDRAVTQDEVDAFRAGVVAEADVSGDGNISLDEFETIYLKMTRERMVDRFQKLDADGDGVVTQTEMDKQFGDIVARMDRNDDGKLDRADHKGHGKKGHGKKGEERKGEGHGKKNCD